MSATDDLAFESEFVGILSVECCDTHARSVGEASNSQCRVTFTNIAGNGFKVKGTMRIEVGDESDAMRSIGG